MPPALTGAPPSLDSGAGWLEVGVGRPGGLVAAGRDRAGLRVVRAASTARPRASGQRGGACRGRCAQVRAGGRG